MNLPLQNKFVPPTPEKTWAQRKSEVYSKLELFGYNSLTESELNVLEEAEKEIHPLRGVGNCDPE